VVTTGLITEYNPFHRGHAYHQQQSRLQTGADTCIAVMSGHFLQRGEAALLDKWTRATMAVSAGVDLVVELPFPFACQSAPEFAKGAVRSLQALAGVDHLCFGSESGEIKELEQAAWFLHKNRQIIEKETALLLRSGINYPAARQTVCTKLDPEGEISELLATPNNILAIAYLRAIHQTGAPIRPATIKRIGSGYHSPLVDAGQIASATAIRQRLRKGEDVTHLLPEAVTAIFQSALDNHQTSEEELLFTMIMARLFQGRDSLKSVYQMDQGLESRFVQAANNAKNLEELIEGCKSRHLTRTRVQRMLIWALFNLETRTMGAFSEEGPAYLQILACNDRGREFIRRYRKEFTLPLVQNFSRFDSLISRFYKDQPEKRGQAYRQLELDTRATRIYTLLQKQPCPQRNRDYYQPVFGLDREG